MKKLLLLVTVVLLGSAAAWAQATTVTPNVGDTKTFTITPTDPNGGTMTTKFRIVYGNTTDVANTVDLLGLSKIASKQYENAGDITVSTATENAAALDNKDIFTANSIDVKWNGSSNNKIYYVIAETTLNDDCKTNNIKVWRVKVNGSSFFITDIALAVKNGDNKVCASNVKTTKYDGADFVYDYGTQNIILKVTSSEASWTPDELTVISTGDKNTGSLTDMTIAANSIMFIEETTPGTVPAASAITKSLDGSTAATAKVIYVKIPMVNGTYEGKVDKNITVYVDGKNASSIPDAADTSKSPAGTFDGADDKLTVTIEARPNMGTAPNP